MTNKAQHTIDNLFKVVQDLRDENRNAIFKSRMTLVFANVINECLLERESS